MFDSLLKMKFKAFIISILVFVAFMCLFSVKWSTEWLFGIEEYQEVYPDDETVEQAIVREMEQVSSGWKGPPKHKDIPVMVWWTPFTGDDGIQDCGDYSCYITNERTFRDHPMLKTIFFYGTDFRPYNVPLPRKPGEDWALFHEESPKNNAIFSHQDIIGHFNHTATFRRSSDFPLTSQYLENLDMITDPNYLIPLNVKNRMVSDGLAPVVYVQSGCDTPSGRDKWVKEFMKYVKVDSYGECLNNRQMPDHIKGSEKMEEREYLSLLAKYKFIIAIENAVCDDYVTEKLWRPFQVGVVPIYLGAPNVGEYLPSSHSAVLVNTFNNVEAVAKHVLELHENDDEYKKLLRHKAAHNGDKENLVQNMLLREMLSTRQWGVSSSQQADMGNFVKHFQCFVCNRVASNLKYTSLGYNPLSYDAQEDHYGCPVPTSPLTGKVDPRNWWTEKWFRSKYEATTADQLYRVNKPFNSSEFFTKVLKHIEVYKQSLKP